MKAKQMRHREALDCKPDTYTLALLECLLQSSAFFLTEDKKDIQITNFNNKFLRIVMAHLNLDELFD